MIVKSNFVLSALCMLGAFALAACTDETCEPVSDGETYVDTLTMDSVVGFYEHAQEGESRETSDYYSMHITTNSMVYFYKTRYMEPKTKFFRVENLGDTTIRIAIQDYTSVGGDSDFCLMQSHESSLYLTVPKLRFHLQAIAYGTDTLRGDSASLAQQVIATGRPDTYASEICSPFRIKTWGIAPKRDTLLLEHLVMDCEDPYHNSYIPWLYRVR